MIIGSFTFRITKNDEPVVSSAATGILNGTIGWNELRRVASDLLPSAIRDLEPNDEWRIELLNTVDNSAFKIRLICESSVE